ncbi:MAG: ShlB/FhaC/HecB family hemolysin secretion/activation protein [Cyanobacteria bacterium P01_A01_bin.45]
MNTDNSQNIPQNIQSRQGKYGIKFWISLNLATISTCLCIQPGWTQSQPNLPTQLDQLPNPTNPSDVEPPSTKPLPEVEPPETLPPLDELLPPPKSPNQETPPLRDIPQTIQVREFKVLGSTIFSKKQIDRVIQEFLNRPLTIAQLYQVRSAITQLYVKAGYITSGAYIPPQKFTDGVLEIQIIEGKLEDIEVRGNRRLKSSYIRSRLRASTKQPLNRDRLLQALQLLQLDPLIENLSAELATGTNPGESLLQIRVKEVNTFNTTLTLDNARSTSVGSFRREIQISEANLLGIGDGISAEYVNTDGSDAFNFNYTIPINPQNGTITISYGFSDNNVIEEPFSILDIESDSRYYELAFRQPITRTPNEEFALGVILSRRESQALYLDEFGEQLPFPVSGADDEGRTKVNALRFFQDWTHRDAQQVFALRSQFSIGFDGLNSTTNQGLPDTSFYAWRLQAQWVRLLARDTLFLLRSDLQFADRPIVAFEQFGLGGVQSVRGYRQDALLKDNGIFASAEVRIPIVRFRQKNNLLQLTPFVDFGSGWNRSGRQDDNSSLDTNTLLSLGLGVRLQLQDYLTARVDWGIPLTSISDEDKDSLQENGIYFSIIANPF